ncbi:MFS transporter [Acidisphaera sp. S103]|uniref:MFS transporter n=1 Tax=Acidisphaera sp. S103 TaxID=1747223 RepID=UPI001C201B76|nr:MFS transporter [Acidisphaera sp. S103]
MEKPEAGAGLPRPDPRRWWILAIVAAAQFVYVVDAFVVNVALPSIRTDLAATTGETQGIIVCYLIAFATLVVTGGRLGDIVGAKKVFLAGLLGFTGASLWCGLTHSGAELVAARTVQGAMAALMIPQVLATIHRVFQDEERGRAIGIYGSALGLGAAVGFGLGGWIVAFNLMGIGWRSIFFVNVPVGLLLAVAALRLMPPAPRKPGARLDVVGAGTLFVSLLALLGPIVVGPDLGWPLWLGLVLALGGVLLGGFVRFERRLEARGGLALVPVDLLADRPAMTAFLAVLCFTFANLAFYLVLTFYMQLGLGYSPLQSGSVVVPLALTFAIVSRKAGPWAQRRGPRAIIEGCCVQALGLGVLAVGIMSPGGSDPVILSGLLIVFGVGQAMAMAPLYGLALSRVPRAHAGSGAGVLSTIQQIGNGSGAAVVGALYFTVRGFGSDRAAFLVSLGVLAGTLLVTVVLLCILRRSQEVRRPMAVRAINA